ncbi:hypothetical protein KDA00_05120, partial [Candidatus Saccharibacteria bacterium]|nr:hypothetical protein [Candidatus Saccharibacteria bacterium]
DQQLLEVIKTADTAIQLIDTLLLSTDMHSQQVLKLEPLSVPSVLHVASEDIKKYAEVYNCEVELSIYGNYNPVIGNFEALRAAFRTLGNALVESQSGNGLSKIVLAAHKSPSGINAGVYCSRTEISKDMFKRARALFGSSRQPLVASSSGSAAGVFIADSLLSLIATPLQVTRYKNMTGLTTTLLPSQQLKLI